jgi:dihydroorotate dehydrogenase subfamily 2
MKRFLPAVFSLIGCIDAGYLTYEHYAKLIIPCSTGFFVDCGKVLESPYATPFGIPLALIGVIHYSILLIVSVLFIRYRSVWIERALFILTFIGLCASIVFVYLQIFVIGAICIYCMVSALNSLAAYIVVRYSFQESYKGWILWIFSLKYRYIIKNIFFLIPPERIHTGMTRSGELIGTIPFVKAILSWFTLYPSKKLEQSVSGIHFHSPLGLAAGFDYEARLTGILPCIGFGFQSVGTITNLPYQGNKGAMLGRLPKSKSLMVNKGFKNDGARAVIEKLTGKTFEIPVGISIGQTNGLQTKSVSEVIEDIIKAFSLFEESQVKHAYYELNISCPNLSSSVSFYSKQNLEKVLKATDTLKLKKPVFIKMPIEKSDKEFIDMLDVITKHSVAGIIVGNLQKNKKDPAFHQGEVSNWKQGGFSGKPTEKRSNELISLTYKRYGKKLTIIGCGGVFSAEDAYEKIQRGARLVQFITGLIYVGPQLPAQINRELDDLLRRDGYTSITQAVGAHHD